MRVDDELSRAEEVRAFFGELYPENSDSQEHLERLATLDQLSTAGEEYTLVFHTQRNTTGEG